MKQHKVIALVAHDNRKPDLIEWVSWNHALLAQHSLVCTGTTGRLVEEALARKAGEAHKAGEAKAHAPAPAIRKLKSGPLGGDQQLGALIAEGHIDIVIFFWDPMEPQPHDVDVKALLRIAVVYNIPMACNRSSADFLISSPLLNKAYKAAVTDYSGYIKRKIDGE